MSLLGLDLGTKTLGLADSDKTNTIASPYKTLTFKKIEDVLPELTALIEAKKIEKLVLGYPKNMNNSLGFAVERTHKFKELLEKTFQLPIILMDERLSSIEAEKILIATDMSREKRKKVIDAYAASIILDTYLKESRD